MNILYEYLFHLHQQISGWWTFYINIYSTCMDKYLDDGKFGDIKIYSIYCASGSFNKNNISLRTQVK